MIHAERLIPDALHRGVMIGMAIAPLRHDREPALPRFGMAAPALPRLGLCAILKLIMWYTVVVFDLVLTKDLFI